MKNNIIKDTFAITLITLIAGLSLGVVNDITQVPIAEQQMKAKEEACKQVFAAADSFGELVLGEEGSADLQTYLNENGYGAQRIDDVMTALDADSNEIGYAFTVTTTEGYGGDIQFVMGIMKDGTVNGISILEIGETAGLGMKADTEEFKSQFRNKKTDKFEYTKNGATAENQIDALSGATVTTNAVTNGVNAGLCAFEFVEGGMEG